MCVSVLKRAVLCLACLGMIIPQGVMASEQTTAPRMDLTLSNNGALSGVVVDTQGRPVKTSVVVKFNGMTVARTRTTTSGRFVISGMRAGVHHIQTGSNTSVARVWKAEAAPASAKTAALLVNRPIVRAQCGESGCTSCATGGPVSVAPFGATNEGTFVNDGGVYSPCGAAGGGCGEGFGPATGGALGGGFGAGTGGLLVGGLVVAGVVTAIAIAANDDDDAPASP